MGHIDAGMTDLCDKIEADVESRKEGADTCDLGFELPSVVPNAPKKEEKSTLSKAAEVVVLD
jgi:hypothetical protein